MSLDLREALGYTYTNEPIRFVFPNGSFVLLRRAEFVAANGKQPYQEAMKTWSTQWFAEHRQGQTPKTKDTDPVERRLIVQHLFAEGGKLITKSGEAPFTAEIFAEALAEIPELLTEVKMFVGSRERYEVKREEMGVDDSGKS